MKPEINARGVKTEAYKYGADLIGIAPIGRFSDIFENSHPLSISPACKSVIVLGKRICRGSLRGVEEGTNFHSTYQTFGYSFVEDQFLPCTVYDLTCFLESAGVEAVPLFGYFSEGMPKGMAVSDDRPEPNVYVDPYYAAQAAGLGIVGKGGFFINSRFGTRLRLAMILVDIELEADSLIENDYCDGCDECVRACPFGAIVSDEAGYQIDYDICRKCPNGACMLDGRGSRPDRIAAACGRVCMISLERRGLLENKFENEFRKRDPWLLDMMNQPINQENKAF